MIKSSSARDQCLLYGYTEGLFITSGWSLYAKVIAVLRLDFCWLDLKCMHDIS